MSRRPRMTLADYLVIAISPALVMAMVGSLVFFLVEVFYQGPYEGRLRWVLAMFVAAAVLIGRIFIELGTERATLYAMPLAAATALAVNRFVVTQGGQLGSLGLAGNLALLGLIWWAAHKLVWDCTFIDESRDYTGEGLLQAAGLQATDAEGPGTAEDEAEAPPEDTQPEHTDPQRAAAGPRPWWSRFRRPPARGHPPGVWIVYFALVALPVFGFGQALIPAADAARRAYGFWLLVTYAASTLGLLLLTAFLGLRRYLRQRWLTMPARMAATWVATGTVLIVAVLVLALALPRPAAEFSWDQLATRLAGSPPRAWRVAVGREGTEDPRPDRARITQEADAQGPAGAPDKPPGGQGRPAAPESSDHKFPSVPGKAGTGVGEADARASPAASQPKTGAPGTGHDDQTAIEPAQPAAQGEKSSAQPASDISSRAPPADNGSRANRPENRPDPQQARSTRSEQRRGQGSNAAGSQAQSGNAKGQREPGARTSAAASASRVPGPTWSELLAGLLLVFKWVFYAVVAAALVILIVRHGREIAAEVARLLADLRAWWAELLAKGGGSSQQAESEEPGPPGPRIASLADFGDPFLTGAAESMTPDELVRYSFEALEAWGREHGCPRTPDQTPGEFAQAVGRIEPALARDARALAGLYGRAAYAAGTLGPHDVQPLARFWQRLRSNGTPLAERGPQASPA